MTGVQLDLQAELELELFYTLHSWGKIVNDNCLHVLRAYYLPGIILSVLHTLTNLIFTSALEVGPIIFSLVIRKLRCRGVKSLA